METVQAVGGVRLVGDVVKGLVVGAVAGGLARDGASGGEVLDGVAFLLLLLVGEAGGVNGDDGGLGLQAGTAGLLLFFLLFLFLVLHSQLGKLLFCGRACEKVEVMDQWHELDEDYRA